MPGTWRRCLTQSTLLAFGLDVGLVCLAAVVMSACGQSARSRGCPCASPPCGSPSSQRARLRLSQAVLPTAASGLSGLARQDDGTLWALPEDHRALLTFRIDARGRPGPITEHAITGILAGVDTESLAFVADRVLAIGTERMEGDSIEGDEIDVVRVADGAARVVRRLRMPYGEWGVQAVENTGLEGMCASGGILLAAVEHPVAEGARRFAHLGRVAWVGQGTASGASWTHFRLWLTSDEGMISALDCRPLAGGGGLDVIAVERHFGIARVLRFRIPQEGRGSDITPTIAVDLACALEVVPNFEGIVFLDGDRIALLTDNDFGGPDGPSRLFVLTLPH